MYGRGKGYVCLAALLMAIGLAGCSSAGDNLARGMEQVSLLNYQEAVSCFEQGLEAGEDARQLARGLGIAYMGLADYGQAIQYFTESLQLSHGLVEPMDYDLNYYLAAAYTKNGMLAEAEQTYDAILSMKKEESQAYFLRGNVRMGLGKVQEAKGDFDKVVEMEPQNYDRLIQIHQVLANYGCEEVGKEYLRATLEQYNNRMTSFDRGRIFYYLEEYQQAYQELEDARKDGSAEAYLYLGRAYEATGDYNYASNVYNAFLATGAADAEIYNQLGLCELQKGEYQKALDAFQAGLKVENNNIIQTLSYNEIVAYEHLGEFKKAAVLMEAYLKSYPDDAAAKREYDFLKTR